MITIERRVRGETSPTYTYCSATPHGPGRHGCRNLVQALSVHGWRCQTLGGSLVLSHREPGGLLEALHTPESTPRQHRRTLTTRWELTARPGPGEPAAWTLRFSSQAPPRLPIAVATALITADGAPGTDRCPHYLLAAGQPEQAIAPLVDAGWFCDPVEHDAWYAPDGHAVVLAPRPDELGHGAVNWLFAAHRAPENTPLWRATAHPRTPTHVIRALSAEIAIPPS
nr:DUF317 domain-containing protein [Streptomyces noursei]